MQSDRPNYPPEYSGIRRNLLIASTTLFLSCAFLIRIKDGASFNGLELNVVEIEYVRIFVFMVSLYEFSLFSIMGKNARKKWSRGDGALNDAYAKLRELHQSLKSDKFKVPKISEDDLGKIVSIFGEIQDEDRKHRRLTVELIKSLNEKVHEYVDISAKYKDTYNDLRNILKNIGKFGDIDERTPNNIAEIHRDLTEILRGISDIETIVWDLNKRNYDEFLKVDKVNMQDVVELKNRLSNVPSIKQLHSETLGTLSEIRRNLGGMDRGIRAEVGIFDTFPSVYFAAVAVIFFLQIAKIFDISTLL